MPQRFYKELGETSFQCVERFRREFPEFTDERLSFAGRLDPMAEGEMLILIGDDNDNRDEFLSKDKEYETEFIFGITTDTFDVMGKIAQTVTEPVPVEKIQSHVQSYVKTFEQKFPPFSKRHVKGKAMFVWATEGRLDEIEIPSHEVTIYDVSMTHNETISGNDIVDYAHSIIPKIHGDFRQDQILAGWDEWQKTYGDVDFQKISLTVRCSTGTYIRQLAHDVGQELGCGAIAMKIKRNLIQ